MHNAPETRPFDLIAPLLDVLWADGRMSFPQVRAVDQVATRFGVDDVAMRIARVPLDELDGAAPPATLRPVAYALAVWVAGMDGRLHPSEEAVLRHFAQWWELAPEVERQARRIALGMARVARGRPTQTHLEALLRAARQLGSDDLLDGERAA